MKIVFAKNRDIHQSCRYLLRYNVIVHNMPIGRKHVCHDFYGNKLLHYELFSTIDDSIELNNYNDETIKSYLSYKITKIFDNLIKGNLRLKLLPKEDFGKRSIVACGNTNIFAVYDNKITWLFYIPKWLKRKYKKNIENINCSENTVNLLNVNEQLINLWKDYLDFLNS